MPFSASVMLEAVFSSRNATPPTENAIMRPWALEEK